ncbi:MAG: YceH family protein [Phycisphaerales bacterium]|nr:YceH family protein [Phycisphaerales bacterium]
MAETLPEIERRILGVLIEKALSQPQYYPMTLNALVAACNQKNNRDPLMDLDDEAAWNALEVLRTVGLVTRLVPGGASRVERYRHEVKVVLGWEKPQQALMAELLLRGPQTLSELRTRCARMYPFESTEVVSAVLETLAEMQPPRIVRLPRGPGQAADRFAHTLYPEGETPPAGVPGAPPVAAPAASGSGADPGPLHAAATARDVASELDSLRAEVTLLRNQLQDLHTALDALRRELGSDPDALP